MVKYIGVQFVKKSDLETRMDTRLVKINVDNIDDKDLDNLKEAARLLRSGELVAFPTETVYGLGGDALREDAAKKIYAAKGRPSDNPLIVHVSDIEQVERIAKDIPDNARILMEKFWPGPLTIVFNKKECVPHGTTGGLDTVAVRMPNHNVARELIRTSGVLLAAPSANLSGGPSPTCAEHVYEDMQGRIPMIIDGGQVGIGLESTIVDVTDRNAMILRPGFITREMLQDAIGDVDVDKAILEPAGKDYKPKAPGMKYRHYAPKAELTLFDGDIQRVVEHINELVRDCEQKGMKVGVIASDETVNQYICKNTLSIGTREDETTIAHNLYYILRQFDEMNVDVIFGECFSDERLGNAIMNRLKKAAGYKVTKV